MFNDTILFILLIENFVLHFVRVKNCILYIKKKKKKQIAMLIVVKQRESTMDVEKLLLVMQRTKQKFYKFIPIVYSFFFLFSSPILSILIYFTFSFQFHTESFYINLFHSRSWIRLNIETLVYTRTIQRNHNVLRNNDNLEIGNKNIPFCKVVFLKYRKD